MRCKFPDCTEHAVVTWALVDLCGYHHSLIKAEFINYYAKRISKDGRENYSQIEPLTPWGKKVLQDA